MKTIRIKGEMKMKAYRLTTMILLLMALPTAMNAFGETPGPKRPDVQVMLDAGREAKISGLAGLPLQEVFQQLTTAGYQSDQAMMYKAIYRSFHNRKSDALALARNYLSSPLIEMVGGRVITRVKEFNVARRIFETFPEESTALLLDLYKQGDATAKGNIIRAAGGIAGGQDIRRLLIRALDDTSFCEEENPDATGERMRICDVAYNQLVLRYSIRNVLRTISPAHRIKTRDYHIAILRDMLSQGL